jgi:uncharacterized protein
MPFANRTDELNRLEQWWGKPGGRLGIVWGRRRVGKTALLQRFAENRRAIFHTFAGRPPADELSVLSQITAPVLAGGLRDLQARPFSDWADALEAVAAAADEPILLVLDEFPEALAVIPELPGILRATWDRVRTRTQLRILLCGSAIRIMESIQEERAPLYGRLDVSLHLHPFRPHEAALMLPSLTPADRALVWGLVGGVPLYLEWWDEGRTVEQNLLDLACTPAGRLLTEGDLLMSGEGFGELGRQVLYAIAAGRTKHNEIADAVRAEPTRTLERLVELRLVERLVPVTEDPRRTRRRIYRLADNFLAFWLACLERYRGEIDRGLGRSILPVLRQDLDDHLGLRWEEAFRLHLRRLAGRGDLGPDIVAVGPFWRVGAQGLADDPPTESAAEIDAVVLAGRSRTAVLVGEAKWTVDVDARRVKAILQRKARSLPSVSKELRFAVCARERVLNADDIMAVTAADIFAA